MVHLSLRPVQGQRSEIIFVSFGHYWKRLIKKMLVHFEETLHRGYFCFNFFPSNFSNSCPAITKLVQQEFEEIQFVSKNILVFNVGIRGWC